MENLYDKLKKNSKSGCYPFHMPGHKRMAEHPFLKDFPNPYLLDITEIEGFDNLHHPEGILKSSMEKVASIYGADKSYYLVNGSSCGVLSAICGTTKYGDTVIMGRNCHKSAYHGAFLNRLETKYLYPRIIEEFGIQGGVERDDLEAMLKAYESVSAVFVVSPTYDGVVSDIESISSVCHQYGIPLIVDEAHGAHFRYGDTFPRSALESGADVVIQSLHKTLPSFTQTGLLHIKEGYVDAEKIEFYLQIFQSSSPSYLFMAGMERCITFMETEGKLQMKEFEGYLMQLRKKLEKMKCLKLLSGFLRGSSGVYDLDGSKIVVSSVGTAVNGQQLMDTLRQQYHLELEMCGADYVTALTSVMDTRQGLKRLEDALTAIDSALEGDMKAEDGDRGNKKGLRQEIPGKACMPLYEAHVREKRRVRLADSEGLVSGEYIYLYPPGIPLVVPGEIITQDIITTIISYREAGLPIQGLKDYRGEWIQVV